MDIYNLTENICDPIGWDLFYKIITSLHILKRKLYSNLFTNDLRREVKTLSNNFCVLIAIKLTTNQ